MIDELGHILREARETKGYTLREVQDKTRINSRFLEALEMGDFDRLPTPTHVRGFLRNYSRFLGLDPEPLLERYELSQSQRPKRRQQPVIVDTTLPVGPALEAPPENHPFFDPVNMEVDTAYQGGGSPRGGESFLRIVIIIALLGALYLAGQNFLPLIFGQEGGTAELTQSLNEAVQNVLNRETPTPEPTATEEVGASSVILPTGRNEFPEGDPTPTATRPPLPATMETIDLEIIILERAWMEVTIDGNVLFTGIARPADPPYEWTANDEVRINTGNAIGVSVTINNVPLGPLGGRGEAKEEVWTTTN
ncbi:MAG: helix-turn-helix domain-containing protein [Ardenticatenaceae bacterium]|nr:helix-turn-helix domain-containing protein [Anaerolineales bacterium]MCB9007078.1 helix-turn-helix domain-containing protein [Ardenticatenaceae bacterium]